MIYVVFPGSGKTYFCHHHAGYVDADIYALGHPIENYIDSYKHYIRWCLEWGYKIITIAEICVIEALKEMQMEFTLVLPSDDMKETQRTSNPYPNSDSNKRYFTYEYYLRKKFGEKCAKIPVDGGFTCPNIDGKCGVGGCIYCSGRGSGDFAPDAALSVTEQIAVGENLSKKWKTDKKIVYFQAHTNTYAPVSVLREKFYEALSCDGVVGMNIATRADCLGDDEYH